MSDEWLPDLLKTQKSLTEWLEDIKHKDANIIRREDNDKRERLKVLNRIIGLSFDEPTSFEAEELAEKTPRFQKYLDEHKDELCALRLHPKVERLSKLRMRGKKVKDAYQWFLEQEIDPVKYRADFIPHAMATISLIFIVNKYGIQGEIIEGPHTQLTQGFHRASSPVTFIYDFKTWRLSETNPKLLAYLKRLVTFLHVLDKEKRTKIKHKLPATFTQNYLNGYFEVYESDEFGTWFIDYSSVLGSLYSDVRFSIAKTGKSLVSGQIGCAGKAEGKVQIVSTIDLKKDFKEGNILVCEVTTPDYVPLMQKAAAIITDQGGILSHAAIVARELKKPCIVATKNATKVLKNGQKVLVDADLGAVNLVGDWTSAKPGNS